MDTLQMTNFQLILKQKNSKKKLEYIDFDKFDIGGNNAIAGDGKLTGDEALRAERAYTNVYNELTKEEAQGRKGIRNAKYAIAGITRYVSNKTDNKFLTGTAMTLDAILFPFEYFTAIVQASMNSK